jgi:predicted nucleic acid-binding protein
MIIVDTGFWLALANKKDTVHIAAKKRFQDLANQQFITTWCVVTETCYLLQKRVGVDAPKIFINKIYTGKLQIFDLKQHHCQRIEELMEKYKDLPMDLADASLVILAEVWLHLKKGDDYYWIWIGNHDEYESFLN